MSKKKWVQLDSVDGFKPVKPWKPKHYKKKDRQRTKQELNAYRLYTRS